MIFDYVSSGNATLKIFTGKMSVNLSDEIASSRAMIRKLNKDSFNFSILFNAFTEAGTGEIMFERYRDDVHSIHSDSGGLQMITRGLTLDDVSKIKIYDVQSKYSNIAMSFDEIPITTSGKGVSVTDMGSRYFDYGLVKEKALASAINLEKQINRFEELGSSVKPMLIMQGNCIDSFQTWSDVICEYLGDRVKKLYGISMAGTSLGGGHLEDIVRAAAATFVEYPQELDSNNVHLLGVGSISRLIPFVSLEDHHADTHLSFDSTTYSHAMHKGTLIIGGKSLSWNRLPIIQKEYHISRMNEIFANELSSPLTYVEVDEMYQGSLKFEEKYGILGGMSPRFCETVIAVFSYMVDDAQKYCVNTFRSDSKLYSKICEGRGGYGVYKKLKTCRDKQDYNEWYDECSKYISSDRVKSSNDITNTLEAFF